MSVPSSPAPNSAPPRVVLASRRLVHEKVWQASQLEFEDVVAEVDDVAWCLPRPNHAPAADVVTRALNRAGRPFGRDRRTVMRTVDPGRPVPPADLFFALFADASEVGILPYVREEAERCATRVAWIVELWGPQLRAHADYLRQLRWFDHVIVSNPAVVDAVQQMTGVPCSYLPMAVDTARYAPASPEAPARTVDVASWGRRLDGTHEPLVRAMSNGEIFYHFDTVRGPWELSDHVEHRLVQAALLQRTRYSIVYRINDEPGRIDRTGGEESLTNRYFEALAAGTVMLGTAPDSPEWEQCFPWPDAVVPIAAPEPDVLGMIRELDRDPERLARARAASVTTFLRRHDWAHRWREVLRLVGMDERPALAARLAGLEARSRSWERVPSL
jgi:hypothetical protein